MKRTFKPTARPRPGHPLVVRRGSVAVKIYRVRHDSAKAGEVFTLAWHVGERRLTRQFTRMEEAREEAGHVAAQLAAGKLGAARSLSTDDAQTLTAARRLCSSTPILAALEEWSRARSLCHGQLVPAAQAWRDANSTPVRSVLLPRALQDFLAGKRRSGVAVDSTYRVLLSARKTTGTTFAQDFDGRPVATITADALTEWIHSAFSPVNVRPPRAHPVTFNTIRKRLVSLWRWCRKQGYLPRSVQTEAERIEAAREPDMDIGIVSTVEFARVLDLMRTEHPEHLAAAVLAGFCGLRRTELHAQLWSDVYLDRAFVRVTSAKRNTPSKRLVPLSAAAVEWLHSCTRAEERVAPAWGMDRVRVYAKEAGIECPDNAFRHSFISYRVAQTGNVAETALEAGNSPAIVHRHYRELVAKADGELWFSLTPARAASLAAEHDGKVVGIA